MNHWTLVYVDETDDRAWEIAGPSWIHVYEENQPTTRLIGNRRRQGDLRGVDLLEHFTDPPYLRAHDIGLVGSPDTVAANIRQYAEEGSFNVVLGEFNYGFLTEEQVMRSVRLFGEEVIPRLRDWAPF